MTPCLHDGCAKNSRFNVQGIKTGAYCRQHAEDGMVDVMRKRCLHDSCTKASSYNAVGMTPAYCRDHA
ncbi:unnamed protein product, partial [Scytosiphon promiscuus]